MNSLENFDLSGHVALITGGAGLLGREHALALGTLGAHVYLGDVDEKKTHSVCDQLNESKSKPQYFPIHLDVTKSDSIQAALAKITGAEGRFDILVNNAAIDPKVPPPGGKNILEGSRLENFSLEDWDFQLAVGLTGAFLMSQKFGAHMAKHGGGVILNVASDLSVIAPDQRLYRKEGLPEELQPVKPVTYSVVKTGLIGLTRYLAGYWAADNVRVNALSPGGVYNGQDEVFVKKLSQVIPMGRMAEKSEYRSAVQFLCTRASSYMTGQNIVIDGGRSVL